MHADDKLSLSDPASPWVDLGSKAYNFESVRRLMRLTYMQLLQRVAIVNTRPEERFVPKWQRAKWEAQFRANNGNGGGKNEQEQEPEPAAAKKKKGARAKAAKEAVEAEPTILSAVLPKWRPRAVGGGRDARKQLRKRRMLAQVRKEEESKMDQVAKEVQAELLQERSADPLWSAGVS